VVNAALASIGRQVALREALRRLDEMGSGVLLLVRADGTFERTVTDGDIRRLLLGGATLDDSLDKLAHIQSLVLHEGYTRQSALELMAAHGIDHLPVLDKAGVAVRVVDRHELDEQILLSTPHLGEAEREFVEEAFRTNWIAPLGPNVDAFERELADWVGVPHAAALSSGTAAIHLALSLLDVGHGDLVLCSCLTFAASANPILYLGAIPVFIDAEPASWNLSPRALERALDQLRSQGKRPKAVIIVNLYGQSADMDPLLEICERFDVPVIEDAAESLGARYRGRSSGTFGRIGVFSFNGNKIITTSGGGMLVSADESLVKRARFLSTQAREPELHYEHKVVGYNYRMSNILAGVGRGQVRVLTDRIAARRRIFDRYREGLRDRPALEWMPEPEWSFSNRWLSVATLDRTAGTSVRSIIGKLSAEGIEARPVWKPMQLQPLYAGADYFPHEESVSQDLFERGICLPSGTNMTEAQQERVIEKLREIL
jgi:dTDP-4-amino-4,6-dideoxygalactose transaminase/CBS domain-containing protein